MDAWGPFNPAAILGENFNNARQPEMATWPNVNRVNTQGSFKAPPLRNVELTGPYFHTGSKLTLRQELDFYDRGGDFPKMNSAHRDFLLLRLGEEDEALGGFLDPVTGLPVPAGTPGAVPEFTEEQKEAISVAVIAFLLELTDERVAFERAPFDHPEIIVPLDGTAPDNTGGRTALLADSTLFMHVPEGGQAGNPTRLPNFLNVSNVRGNPGNDHYDSVTQAITETVTVQNVTYNAINQTLTVTATSSSQPTAKLTAQGFGALGWKSWLNLYRNTFTDVAAAPASVTVNSNLGGTATSP